MTKQSPFDSIESQHGCPTLITFNGINSANSPHILVSDNEGPIDVIDMQKKVPLRSYLEHSSRVTGLSWYDSQSFVSSSADGTAILYNDRLSQPSYSQYGFWHLWCSRQSLFTTFSHFWHNKREILRI